MLNWVQDELFISNKVKGILSNADVRGFKIYDVINHKTNKPVDDIHPDYYCIIKWPGNLYVQKG